MAHLDLQEQEQLDELKAFWKRYGNAITWLITAVLLAYAAYNGWNWWQRDRSYKASAMFAELDRAAAAGDAQKAAGIFNDLRSRYGATTYAEQGGLLAARTQADKGQAEEALATLEWVATQAAQPEYKALARLRAAGVLAGQNRIDDATRQLDAARGQGMDALVDDRRGDLQMLQGRKDDARTSFLAAWKAMDDTQEYRRVIEAKLMSLGLDPRASEAGAAASSNPASRP